MRRLSGPDSRLTVRFPCLLSPGRRSAPAGRYACNASLTVQLHNDGERYPVTPTDEHTELSYWFDARCAECGARNGEPFVRVDEDSRPLGTQRDGLPVVDLAWLNSQCGPSNVGCDLDAPADGPPPS